MHRDEINLTIKAKQTQKLEEIKSKIAKMFNVPESRLDIIKIATKFGMQEAEVLAFLYDSEEWLKKFKKQKKEKAEKTEKKKQAEKEK